ncbi:MAG: cupredoxin family protein [Pseudomonadota bacterium]
MMKQFLFAAATMALMIAAVTAPHAHSKANQVHGAGIGVSGQRADIGRTLKVDMTDAMRFSPSSIRVKRGETVRFIVTNSGKLKHEMVLGSIPDLKKHAGMMRKNPEMEHADENMVSVDPGKSGELIWKFTASGNVDFACLQPGHFEAGMKGKVAVK